MTKLRPSFFYKNKITDISQINDSASTSDSLLRKFYDRNQETKWYSVGETSGTSTIIWTPSAATTITNIIVQNCNWENFTITYNSGSDFSTPINITKHDNNYFFEFDAVDVTSVEISITATDVSGVEREVGQLVITEKIFSMSENYEDNIQPVPGGKSLLQELSDGTTFKVFVRDTINYELLLNAVPYEERENYRIVYNLNKREAFFFIPNPFVLDGLDFEGFVIDGSGDYLVDGSGDFVVSALDLEFDGSAGHYHWAGNWDFERWYLDLQENGYIGEMVFYQASGIS